MDAAPNLASALRRSFALHAVSRALESAAIGWFAAAVVVAIDTLTSVGHDTSLVGGVGGVEPIGWVGALAGACAAGSYWLERAPRLASHTRRVDDRMGFDGALVTASEAPIGASGMARALVERVATRLRRSDLVRASLPATPIGVIALVAGVAVMFAAHDLAPARTVASPNAESIARAASASAAGDLRRAAATKTGASVSTTAPGGARDEGLGDDERLAERLERFARDGASVEDRARLAAGLRAAAADKRHSPEVVRALTRARDALAQSPSAPSSPAPVEGVTRPTPTTSSGPSTSPDSPALPSPATASSSKASTPTSTGANGPSTGTGTDSSLASLGGDGRMGPPRTDGIAPAPTSAAVVPPGEERGVSTLRWWSTEDDVVVERWVDSRRPR